jgi:hypothetical protein
MKQRFVENLARHEVRALQDAIERGIGRGVNI